ncbi:MAG: GNAT family N-acetyltransferase [Bacteroides sp.]|nr:GNAT family N-acetyltransferase [Bacteroides sp.]MBD5362429.1 GNAT family N-acetyltransferase [Bacteroides sp.]
MDFSKFTFRQIETDTEIMSFDCGDDDLNDFLVSDAKNYLRAMMALTYLLEDNDESKTVAYYSLLNDKIVFDPDDKHFWNKLNRKISNKKRRKEYPAVKIGRLAVSKDYAGNRIGEAILLQIKHMFSTMRRSACRFITVDAYSAAIPFYEKCGFSFLSEKDKNSRTRAMYFDLINFGA